MSAIHVVVDHMPSAGHSDGFYALVGALAGAAVTGLLGIIGLGIQSRHENGRLQRRLAHDRDQQDLEVLRVVLGDAAEAVGRTRAAFVRLLRYIDFGPVGEAATRREDAMHQQRVAAAATRAALDRLRLQLGPDDPLIQAYETVMDVLDRIADVVAKKPPDYASEIDSLNKPLADATDEFIRLARARVGPRGAMLGP